MPEFNVSVPHKLDRDDVVERLKGFSEQIRSESPVILTDVVESWDHRGNLTFSFRAMGMKVSGSVVTSDSEIEVVGNLPWAASMIRGRIETQIAVRIRDVLSRE